jgi:hypothetical protein
MVMLICRVCLHVPYLGDFIVLPQFDAMDDFIVGIWDYKKSVYSMLAQDRGHG